MTWSMARVVACSGVFVMAALVTSQAQAPGPPTALPPQVSGNVVTVSWTVAPGAAAYVLQAGTAAGAANLFNANIGNTTSATGTLPPGTYFWRVLAVGPSGELSAPSGESQFTVGGGACVPPGPPQSLTSNVAGVFVSLQWGAPASGGPATGYVIEAGSGSGLANLAVLPTGNPATQFGTGAPPGQYFVRVRSQNACGVSGPSNEVVVAVGVPQGGGDCLYALSPPSINIPLAGGPIEVNIAASGNCRWQVQADPFIVPVSSTSGAGSTSLAFLVQPSAAPRNGTVTISAIDPGTVTAPQTIVQQITTGGCAVTLTPTSQDVGPGAGQFQLRVNANPGCPWSVAPLAGFVSIVSAGLQSGTDNIIYNVAANTAVGARTGGIRISSAAGVQDFAITQQGVGALTASFVMREGGQIVESCQVNQGLGCSLDATTSSPAAQIVSYSWTTQRFAEDGTPLRTDTYSGVTTDLDTGCTVGGATIELFTVSLTITNTAGQTASISRQLQLKRAGCGT